MYTIKIKNGGLLGCVSMNDSKPYVVGFSNLQTVAKVTNILTIPPRLTLKRKHTIDVTDGVKGGLLDMGISEFAFNKINIDVEAELSIEKSIKSHPINLEIQINLMEDSDFIFMSFQNNVGLIIPYEEMSEDAKFLKFKANVIEPSGDTEIFKQMLNKDF
jgi:hypothetical protein